MEEKDFSSKKIYSSKYLIDLSPSKILNKDNDFVCPICQCKDRSSTKLTESKQSSQCIKPNTDKEENVQHDLDDFRMELSMELAKLREERSRELNKFHQNIDKLVLIIEKKEYKHRADIEKFYDEKELKIEEISKEIDKLKKFTKTLSVKSIKERLSYMKNRFKYEIRDVILKDNCLEADKFVKELKTGKVIFNCEEQERIGSNELLSTLNKQTHEINHYECKEKSILEYTMVVNEFPSLIVSNNEGFFGLIKDDIVHLDTKELLYYSLKAMGFTIRDLTVSENGRICFLSRRKDKLKSDYYNSCIDSLDKSPLFLHIAGHNQAILLKEKVGKIGENLLCFFPKSEILIHYTSNNYYYSFKKGMSSEFVSDLRIKDNIIYILQSEFDVRYYNVLSKDINENFIGKPITVFLTDEQITLKDLIIKKLKRGHFLLTNTEMIFIINPNDKKLIAIPQKKIFKDGFIRCYRIFQNEIIFCIQNIKKRKKLIFKYFYI